MLRQNVIPLNDEADIANNVSKLDQLFRVAIERLIQEDRVILEEHIRKTKDTIAAFATNNGITLGSENLLINEEQTLLQIIIDELQNKDELELNKQLSEWKTTLKHAVAGQGEHVAMHAARSSGMADDLIHRGAVPPGKWGTDLDVKQCLGDNITDVKEIARAGSYILAPVSLTEQVDDDLFITPFHAVLDEVHKRVNLKKIDGNVTVSIPVNCGDQHWRLAKINFNDQRMTSAVLWDSLQPGNEDEIKETPAFQNFTQIVESYDVDAKPELQLAGVQHNAYSCMDYAVQEAYKEAGIENEIAAADTANDLRFEVVKQIANNHPAIDDEVVATLTMNHTGSISFGEPEVQPEVEKDIENYLEKFTDKEQSEVLTQDDKEWQINFDAVFSQNLKKLFDENPGKKVEEEPALLREARRRAIKAMLEFGLFPPADKKGKVNNVLDELNSSRNQSNKKM